MRTCTFAKFHSSDIYLALLSLERQAGASRQVGVPVHKAKGVHMHMCSVELALDSEVDDFTKGALVTKEDLAKVELYGCTVALREVRAKCLKMNECILNIHMSLQLVLEEMCAVIHRKNQSNDDGQSASGVMHVDGMDISSEHFATGGGESCHGNGQVVWRRQPSTDSQHGDFLLVLAPGRSTSPETKSSALGRPSERKFRLVTSS